MRRVSVETSSQLISRREVAVTRELSAAGEAEIVSAETPQTMSMESTLSTMSGRGEVWSTPDQVVLVEEVHKRKRELFGDVGGADRGASTTRRAWEAIQAILASR